MKMQSIITSYILVVLVYIFLIPLAIMALGPRLDALSGLPPLPRSTPAAFIALAYAWFWIIWSQVYLIMRGKGHPNEILGYELSPTTTLLVADGPYRHTRNPMAYGLLIFYFIALAIFSHSTITLLLFPVGCLFEVWYHRRFEEPGLLRRFGEEYERYRRDVPLLLPFLKRRF